MAVVYQLSPADGTVWDWPCRSNHVVDASFGWRANCLSLRGWPQHEATRRLSKFQRYRNWRHAYPIATNVGNLDQLRCRPYACMQAYELLCMWASCNITTANINNYKYTVDVQKQHTMLFVQSRWSCSHAHITCIHAQSHNLQLALLLEGPKERSYSDMVYARWMPAIVGYPRKGKHRTHRVWWKWPFDILYRFTPIQHQLLICVLPWIYVMIDLWHIDWIATIQDRST